jgi:hypothetical protein
MSQVTYKISDSVLTDSAAKLSGNDIEVGSNHQVVSGTYAAGSTNVALSLAFTVANLQAVFLKSDQGCTLKTNGTGTSEVQTISITGTPTGGTFTLAYSASTGAQVTAPIAYNAAASAVQTALRALAAIGSTGVNCTGGPLPGTAVVCTFAGTLANTNVPTLASDGGAGLTGGTTPAVSVVVTTAGLPSNVITFPAGIPYVWRKSAGYNACLFTVDVTSAYVSSTLASQLNGFILTS